MLLEAGKEAEYFYFYFFLKEMFPLQFGWAASFRAAPELAAALPAH